MSTTVWQRLYYGETRIDFPKTWRWTRIVSAVLLVLSIGSLLTRGLNLGIEFEGGTSWEVVAPGKSVADARDVLRTLGEADAIIQIVNGDTLRIQSATTDPQKVVEITNELKSLGEVGNFQSVGPSWGNEITKKALRALVVFFVLLALYISWRLEWKMAVGALLAVVHDILISVGVYSILQLQVTPATVISFLTILGYSLYDTVVVYDKVHELTARPSLANRYTYTDTMNLALNQVLMRSINTTLAGILPVLAMLIVGSLALGATTLQEFALALLVGLTVGAYSSIFVAAPIVAWLKEREPKYRQTREKLQRGGSAGGTRILDEHEVAGLATGGARVPRPTPVATGSGAPVGAAGSSAIPPRPRKKKRR
jgi:preprotein translocase subunit SecF